jgi:hypothetical protein
MSVRVAFIEDPIRKNGALMARLVLRNKVSFEQLLSYMQNSTGLAETDMRAMFLHFMNALVFFLAAGGSVQTPVGTFAMSLGKSGLVDRSGLMDRKVNLDMVTLRLRPDIGLLDRVKLSTSFEVVDMPTIQCPTILQVINLEQANVFNAGSVGQILEIGGNRLSFDKEDAETGVFFIEPETEAETRAQVYSRIGTAWLDFKIPALTAGAYTLEVRTRPTGKGLRVGEYGTPITIA